MTKKDYIIIAGAIKAVIKRTPRTRITDTIINDLIETLSSEMKLDNDRFDSDLFKKFINN